MLKFSVIGFLGKDAETKSINGKTVIEFSVAHSERGKDNNGNATSKSVWVSCSQWSDNTKLVPYLLKGTQVFVEGNGELRQWTTNDGKSGANLTLRVSHIQLLGNSNNQSQGSSEQNFKQNLGNKSTDFNDADSVPF